MLVVMLALVCSAAGALSAFDAWPWFPTLFAVLALAAARGHRDRLRALALAAVLAGGASLGGAATRVAINWWHFGSLERGRAGPRRGLLRPQHLLHPGPRGRGEPVPTTWSCPGGRWRRTGMDPRVLADAAEPTRRDVPARAAAGALGRRRAALLASPGWLCDADRRAAGGATAHWPGRRGWLVALDVAALPFVLLCPAIAVQQAGPLLAFTPAALLGGRVGLRGLAGPPPRDHARRFEGAWLVWRRARVAVAVVVRDRREPGAATPSWPAPPAECQAALRALSQLEAWCSSISTTSIR